MSGLEVADRPTAGSGVADERDDEAEITDLTSPVMMREDGGESDTFRAWSSGGCCCCCCGGGGRVGTTGSSLTTCAMERFGSVLFGLVVATPVVFVVCSFSDCFAGTVAVDKAGCLLFGAAPCFDLAAGFVCTGCFPCSCVGACWSCPPRNCV